MTSDTFVSISIADDQDREQIYAIRHTVYAQELGQHEENAAGRLKDALDAVNVYVVAKLKGEIAGFISITPPNEEGFSIDRHFPRADVPLHFDDGLYEVRLLTVAPSRRASRIAAALMYGAWRYVASRGGLKIVALGRQEIVPMYERVGFKRLGIRTRSGRVTYELMTRSVDEELEIARQIADCLEKHVAWSMASVSFRSSDACYHGGAFFEAVGDEFDRLSARHDVINADVLDAWFDPSPAVVDAISKHLPWTLKTSPPTGCDGMRRVLARARGVHQANLLPGAGSSDLIFLALRHWLRRESRVLILDPMYGEYAHVLEKVIGCRVDRLRLSRARNYALDCAELAWSLKRAYDLVVLVNPNSPTGQHVRSEALQAVISAAPAVTRFWIDETYIDYVSPSQSLERFASTSENVVICKSMSKAYALSGARCAYLCGPAALMDALRIYSPPWAVSLPGQIAACAALGSGAYYGARWEETRVLRAQLASALRHLGWDVVPGSANFLLCHLPPEHPEASSLASACRMRKLFIRDVSNMGKCFDERVVRVAVKDAATNEAIVSILTETLAEMMGEERKVAA